MMTLASSISLKLHLLMMLESSFTIDICLLYMPLVQYMWAKQGANHQRDSVRLQPYQQLLDCSDCDKQSNLSRYYMTHMCKKFYSSGTKIFFENCFKKKDIIENPDRAKIYNGKRFWNLCLPLLPYLVRHHQIKAPLEPNDIGATIAIMKCLRVSFAEQ